MSKPCTLRFTGEVPLNYPVEPIWQFIAEPTKVSRCVPGLTSWEEQAPQQIYLLSLTWLSNNKTNLIIPAKLIWESVSPPHQLKFTVVATPPTVPPVNLKGQFDLIAENPHKSVLNFTAVIQTPNPFLNQLVKNILPKQIERFFRCLKSKL